LVATGTIFFDEFFGGGSSSNVIMVKILLHSHPNVGGDSENPFGNPIIETRNKNNTVNR